MPYSLAVTLGITGAAVQERGRKILLGENARETEPLRILVMDPLDWTDHCGKTG